MAEDNENKTEQPTEKRLHEAQERGQFARSPDLGLAAGLLVSAVLVGTAFPGQARQIAQIATVVFSHVGQYELRVDAAADLSKAAITTMVGLCLPALVTCMVGGMLVSGLQSGFRFTPDLLDFKADRLNPLTGFQRIVSAQGLVKLGLDILKLTVVGLALNSAVQRILSDPVFFTPTDIAHLGTFLQDTAGSLLKQSALGIGLVAATHYFLQKRKLNKDLMMSKQEVKEEHQASEGDPMVKSQRRAMGRRMMQKQMFAAVATADVIVTNPTHYAVAIRYDRGRDRAPVVLAKGRNRLAQRIKALGAEHDVPTVENVPVARALYKHVPVGQPISSQLYKSVAEILTFVYKTHRYYFHRLKGRRAALVS